MKRLTYTEASALLIDVILVNKTTNILATEVCDPFIPNMVRFHCPVVNFLSFLNLSLNVIREKYGHTTRVITRNTDKYLLTLD